VHPPLRGFARERSPAWNRPRATLGAFGPQRGTDRERPWAPSVPSVESTASDPGRLRSPAWNRSLGTHRASGRDCAVKPSPLSKIKDFTPATATHRRPSAPREPLSAGVSRPDLFSTPKSSAGGPPATIALHRHPRAVAITHRCQAGASRSRLAALSQPCAAPPKPANAAATHVGSSASSTPA
jgi:hypothetical protein